MSLVHCKDVSQKNGVVVKKYVALLLVCWMSTVWACEPVAFDFEALLHDADRNKDGFVQESELLLIPNDRMVGLDKAVNTKQAFSELDSNHDQKLSEDELWMWGKYTHNGCAEWNRRQINRVSR